MKNQNELKRYLKDITYTHLGKEVKGMEIDRPTSRFHKKRFPHRSKSNAYRQYLDMVETHERKLKSEKSGVRLGI